jgi:predicted SAM-dependent methyltransferase
MKSLRKAIRELLYIPINFFTKLRLRSKIKSTSNKLQIIIGAHNTEYNDWLPTNIDSLNLLQIASFQHLFGDKKVSRFLAEHVFEHITYADALTALKNCYSYLEKGGAVRIAVPDGFHPNPDYINMVKPGGFGEGAHDHKLLYDYKKLSKVFEEEGTFHYNDWDSKDGHVIRSKRYDKRFNEPLGYSSLIVDGIKE